MDLKTQIESAVLLIGKRAPDFTARSTKGEISMSAYEGSWTLLFCHPAIALLQCAPRSSLNFSAQT